MSILILNAKAVNGSELKYELFRDFPDVGELRVFVSQKLKISNVQTEQMKNLLAGHSIKLRGWHVGVIEDSTVILTEEQRTCQVLTFTNMKTGYVHLKVYATTPTPEQIAKFNKFIKQKDLLTLDRWIDLYKDGHLEVQDGDFVFEYKPWIVYDNR